jgi:DNA polymerase III epsilon subunit-like protein
MTLTQTMKPTDTKLKEIKEKAAEWAAERLADLSTVICDTETTGLPSKDPDTEICQLSITDNKGKPLFSMLIKPNKPMDDVVIGIHGITNEQVQHQPMFPQVAKMIAFVLENKHVVCWNADFDIALLWSLFRKYDQKLPKTAGASCAMDKYSEWCGEWNTKRDGFKWQRLPALSGLPAHDAYADCLSTLKAIELMASKFDPAAVEAEEISLDF